MITSIPTDIWIHVAKFISPDELRAMLSVNRTFFHLAMAEIYRTVSFPNHFDAEILDKICQLRDPVRAHCIRKLDLDVRYGSYLRSYLPPVHEIIKTMTDTVTCLTNVTEFFIRWTYAVPTAEELHPFLTAAWKTFGSSLETLDIHTSLTYLPTLLSTADGHISPRALVVTLDPEINGPHHGENKGAMMAAILAPFINKMSPTLRKLKLKPRMFQLKLSPLFHQLGNIPNLEQFDFELDYDVDLLSDPCGITRFFCAHAGTLRHVRLWSDTYFNSPYDGRATIEHVADWLNANEGNKDLLSNLLTLHWKVPVIRGLSFDSVVRYIKRSAHTLTTLRLYGYSQSYGEVYTLLSVLATRKTGHLRELWLTVTFVSPELIILLARTLPRLDTLRIDASFVRVENEAEPTTAEEEISYAQQFAATIRMTDIHDWWLHSIDIRVSTHELGNFGSLMGFKLMWVLAECVPSVKMFGTATKEKCIIGADDYL